MQVGLRAGLVMVALAFATAGQAQMPAPTTAASQPRPTDSRAATRPQVRLVRQSGGGHLVSFCATDSTLLLVQDGSSASIWRRQKAGGPVKLATWNGDASAVLSRDGTFIVERHGLGDMRMRNVDGSVRPWRGPVGQREWGVRFALSPDDTTVATLSESGAITRTAVSDGASVTIASDAEAEADRDLGVTPSWLAFDAGGTRLATISFVGARIWSGGGKLVTPRLPSRIDDITGLLSGFAFAPSGAGVAVELLCGEGWGSNTIALWNDDGTRRCPSVQIGGHGFSCGFSPDGRTLFAAVSQHALLGALDRDPGRFNGGWEGVQCWTVTPNALVPSVRINSGDTVDAAWSPDGTTIATAGADGRVRFWNPTGVEQGGAIPGTAVSIGWLVASGDGSVLACACGTSAVALINLDAEPYSRRFARHAVERCAVAIANDGSHLAAVDRDGTAEIWDRTGAACATPFASGSGFDQNVEFSAAGDQLIVCRNGDAFAGRGGSRRFGLDGAALASTDVDGKAGECRRALARVGGTVVTATNDTVSLWNADGSLKSQFLVPDKVVEDLALTPRGGLVATRSGGGLRLFTSTGAVVSAFPTGEKSHAAVSMAFVDDTHLATCGQDGIVKLWDTAGHQLAHAVVDGALQVIATPTRLLVCCANRIESYTCDGDALRLRGTLTLCDDGFVVTTPDNRFGGVGPPVLEMAAFEGVRQLNPAELAAYRTPWLEIRAAVFGLPPTPTSRPK